MPAVPTLRPFTMPVADPTVAELPLAVHRPPDGRSVSVVVEPTHTCSEPDITPGTGFTVNIAVVVQPAPSEYVISELPVVCADTIPDDDPIVAMAGADEVHVPPTAGSVKVTLPPTHAVRLP